MGIAAGGTFPLTSFRNDLAFAALTAAQQSSKSFHRANLLQMKSLGSIGFGLPVKRIASNLCSNYWTALAGLFRFTTSRPELRQQSADARDSTAAGTKHVRQILPVVQVESLDSQPVND